MAAYYFRFEAGQSQRRETITSEALQEAARLCARPRFKHPVMTLTNAKNQGYLDSPVRGEFSINTIGENLVAMTLPGGERATNGKRKKRRESAPAKRTAKR